MTLFASSLFGAGDGSAVSTSAHMTVFIISVFGGLIISGFCSLMESVLLSITPIQVAELTEKSPKIGAIWNGFKKSIDNPMSAILILNTAAHTIGATVAGNELAEMLGQQGATERLALVIFSILFTFVTLQYTEILPKTIGVRNNKAIALWLAFPLYWMTQALAPVSRVIYFLNRPFEPKGPKSEHVTGADELRYMAAMARQNQQIGIEQEGIIVAAAGLSRKSVADVMIPIEDVILLPNNLTLDEAIEIAYVDAHTRFPVHEKENKKNIIGYVNFKEIIAHQKLETGDKHIGGIVRQVAFTEVDNPASELLILFTHKHEHLAMVRNKAGDCVGMVTLEDIIEELVGELDDEFDALPKHVQHLKNHALIMGGGCTMDRVRKIVTSDILHAPHNRGYDFVSQKDDSKKLDTWIEERLGRVAQRGDQLVINGVEFKVRRIRRGHTFDVQIKKAPESEV
ncbi:MAG: hemolysin family protein [Thermoguttaceae bacterium]|nr:hemolysin family protein [Thermoguttaceae bacterium]